MTAALYDLGSFWKNRLGGDFTTSGVLFISNFDGEGMLFLCLY